MKWELLHKEMLAEIEKCLQLPVEEKEKVEFAFKIALNVWEDIKKELPDHTFENEETEIYFYKNIKPTFTSYIEYLTLVYLGLCYVPPDVPEIKISFWEAESKKLQKFIDKNAAFVSYYKSKSTELDLQYFLPANYDLGNLTVSKIYDMDGMFMSSHDHLVAMLFAHEMYHGFVKKELEKYA